ncbi:MAG: response regulator transcription factor [Pseudomonadales bacterium]|nr:response regulator transcription factor [Pseudomonadales bacterium]
MSQRRVLVVEDNADTRAWLCQCAATAWPDGEIFDAGDVAGARTLLTTAAFDVAIVDLGLPDGSGVDVITAIRRTSGVETYIIVATIYDDDRNLFTALRAGAQGYILKDQDRDKVVSFLQGITRGEPAVSTAVTRKMVDHFNARATSKQESNLAPREQEVLGLIAKGLSVTESAKLLGLTNNTVKGYVKSVYTKLGVTSRAEATAEAIRLGLVDID